MIDRTNKSWNNKITDEEIFNREFTTGYLIQCNQHLPIFQQLKDIVLSTYKVRAIFTYLGYNGQNLYCNGQRLVYRTNKFKDFSIGKNVTLISHNFSHKGGGSNSYPTIAYTGAKCELEFISYGLPYVDSINGWKIEVIKIDKINS